MNPPEVELTRPAAPLVGGTPFGARLVVRNTGPEVERYELVSVGPLAAWTTVEEAELRIWPGEERELAVTVMLPPGPAPAAGASEIGVMAIAGDGAWGESRQPAQVAPRPQAVLHTPTPHAVRTARRALVHLALADTGNTGLALELTARDREGRLVHENRPHASRVTLAPGQAVTMPMVLRCDKPAWLGRAVPRDYTVEATGGPVSVSAGGVLVQEPVLRKWWFVGLGLLLVLAFASRDGNDLLALIHLLLVLAIPVCVVVLLVVVVNRYTRVVRGEPPDAP